MADLNRALKGQASRGNSYELRATVAPGDAGEFAWRLMAGDGKYTAVGYGKGELFVDRVDSGITDFSKDFPVRVSAPLTPGGAPIELTILVDRSTVEVFAQRGAVAISSLAYPPPGAQGIEFQANGKPGRATVDITYLKSTWR